MSNRLELNDRITAGHIKIESLKTIISGLQSGGKRDELGAKLIRMLHSIHDLEDSLCDIYPGFCLYTDMQCSERNKGCSPCNDCKEYINAFYAILSPHIIDNEKQEQERLI